MTRVKICGLARRQDAELAIELGADALGFVLEPSSPRYIGRNQELIYWALDRKPFDPKVVAVYGVCRDDPGAFDFAQAHTFEDPTLPGKLLVVRPTPEFRIGRMLAEIDRLMPWGITLDAFDPVQHGGTGQRLDVGFAASVQDGLESAGKDLPIILAGGLTPENVSEAIVALHPYAVDVSSGIETSPGIKDPAKMRDFVQAARSA